MNGSENNVERIPVKIYEDSKQASAAVAQRIREIIEHNNSQSKPTVLGLATGHTPVNVYRELIRMHRDEALDFTHVTTFNLDEYYPIQPDRLQSYHHWMHENLFKHINIKPENVHLPSGTIAREDIESHCQSYDQAIEDAGGIDFQILGIGRSGHIGFNEPGTNRHSGTQLIHLDNITRKDAASDFFGEENVPETAITMGVGTILKGRELCLLSFGEHKASIIHRAVEGDISSNVVASYLQEHPNVTCYVDEASAAELTRIATPWLLGPCIWDHILKRQAVLWLAQKLNKAILKLTDEDYAEHGLADLLREYGGSCYDLNIEIFRTQMKTISGWPAGKDGPKKVMIFSPHPDDDVICMGGTMRRLVQQGHEVHVAYMVSGCLSVFDHDVTRFADFVREFNDIFNLGDQQVKVMEQHIDQFLLDKQPGQIDSPEIQKIKGLIRKTEAIDAAKYCGLTETNIHFLNLPFYNTGTVQKLSLSEQDYEIVFKNICFVKPDYIFAAGDLSDPHGTHRLCLDAIFRSTDRYIATGHGSPELWLYRGAWQEWAPELIDMAIPLSPDELTQKRFGIFRHQSQKDRAMFPGPYDSREFWQRSEDRNMTTAAIYDAFGLPEYHALEAFVRYPVSHSKHALSQLAT